MGGEKKTFLDYRITMQLVANKTEARHELVLNDFVNVWLQWEGSFLYPCFSIYRCMMFGLCLIWYTIHKKHTWVKIHTFCNILVDLQVLYRAQTRCKNNINFVCYGLTQYEGSSCRFFHLSLHSKKNSVYCHDQ